MTYYQPQPGYPVQPQYAQPQINFQARYEIAVGLIRNALTQAGEHPNIINAFMRNIDRSNPQAPLPAELEAQLNRIATPEGWAAGVPQEVIVRGLWPWVSAHLNGIKARYQAPQQYVQPGYPQQGIQQGFGNIYAAGAAASPVQATVTMYDTTPAAAQPVQPQPQPQQNPITSTWSPPMNQPPAQQTVAIPTTQQSEAEQPRLIQLRTAPICDLPKMPGAITIGEYAQGAAGDLRASYARLTVHPAINTLAELVHYLQLPILPVDLLRGNWAYQVCYKKLVQVPIGTDRYNEIRGKISEIVINDSYQEAVRYISNLNRNEDDAISEQVIARINQLVARRLIPGNDLAYRLTLGSLGDLRDLNNPSCSLKVAQLPGFTTRLNHIVEAVFTDFFSADTVLDLTKPEDIGEFLHSDAITFYNNGVSKVALGFLAEQDKTAALNSLRAKNTVMRHPRQLIITNAMPANNVMTAAVRAASAPVSNRPEEVVAPSSMTPGSMGILDSVIHFLGGDKIGDIEDVVGLVGTMPASKAMVAFRFVNTLDDGLRLIPHTGTPGMN